MTLSDGAVWQLLPSDTSYAQLGRNACDYIVNLSPGDNGEAILDVRGESGSFAVRRVR